MIVTNCFYKHLNDGYTLINCSFTGDYSTVIRTVKTIDLIIEPSSFIGLKFEEAINLNTIKKIKIKKEVNINTLFDDIKPENIQLGLF